MSKAVLGIETKGTPSLGSYRKGLEEEPSESGIIKGAGHARQERGVFGKCQGTQGPTAAIQLQCLCWGVGKQ